MLDWDDLRVFLALARGGTLSAAARHLRVNQSTIGRRLLALEQTAKARLFDRTPEGYVPTAAGEAMLAHAEAIEERVISIERNLVGRDVRVEGRVRLATSDSFASWFLLPRLREFSERYPDIMLELVTGNRPVDLARREADVSLRLSRPEQPNLVARQLGIAAWAVYAARSYLARRRKPRSRDAFDEYDVVGFEPELEATVGAKWLRSQVSRSRVALTANSMMSHAAAVVAGFGIAPLPCVFGDREPELRRVHPAFIGHHDIWIVVHRDVRSSARVRAVVEEIARIVKSESALLAGLTPASPTKNAKPRKPRP